MGAELRSVTRPREIPEDREAEYRRYLQSQRWRTLAKAVRLRAKGKCEICRRADGRECAHLAYDRIFQEPLSDLLWLCRNCHGELDDRNLQ